MNSNGVVSFRTQLSPGAVAFGLYQQSGTAAPVPLALDGQATTLPGGGAYWLASSGAIRTLDNGGVWFKADVLGGEADSGEFLVSQTDSKVLMSTADQLPPGASVVLGTFRPSGSGHRVGFLARRAGGQVGMFIHDIAAQTTSLVVADGDSFPGAGRMRLINSNVVFLNAGGSVAFSAQVFGGTGGPTTAVFLRKGSSLTKIVAVGDTVPGTGRTFSTISLGWVMPSPLNDADQVVLYGTAGGWPNLSGLFLGSTSGVRKIALTGETAPDSLPFYSFAALSVSINQAGQVAFRAVTGTYADQRQGIYVFTPGASPEMVEVVEAGDSGPSGAGTFAEFGYAAINNLGHVAFVARLTDGPTDGPGGGVFFATYSSSTGWPLTALALDGHLAPAGGSYAITVARHDLAMNDQGDVVFRADLTGGSANSGYFLRRGLTGGVEKVVLQGESAPGTDGPFSIINTGINGLLGENVQLDQAGHIAFQAYFEHEGLNVFGCWHVKPDGTIEPVLVRGLIAPEFGGGVAASSSAGLSWNSNARFAMKVRMSGSTFVDGIFLFVPSRPTPTPEGTNVVVQPTDATTGQPAASLTFDTVTHAGETTLTTSAGGPTVPSSFALGDPPLFYNLATTAAFSASIDVCVVFSPERFPDASGLRLLHYEGGTWRDVTTGGGAVGNTICGRVTSLSPFVVAKVITPPAIAVTVTPSVIWPPNNRLVRVTASVRVSDPGGATPAVSLMSITSNEPLAPGDVQAAFGTDCRSFQLRATRLGGGSGRTYTITYRATNVSGLWTETAVQVLVPHDQKKK
jgi:hypothetical protein